MYVCMYVCKDGRSMYGEEYIPNLNLTVSFPNSMSTKFVSAYDLPTDVSLIIRPPLSPLALSFFQDPPPPPPHLHRNLSAGLYPRHACASADSSVPVGVMHESLA